MVSTAAFVERPSGAYLTTTDVGFDYLNALTRSRESIDDWRGVVECEIVRNPTSRAERGIGAEGCYIVVGNFTFFGDPELLARIAAALTEGG